MLQSRVFGVIWLIFSVGFFIFDESYLGLLLLILTGVLFIFLILNIVFLKDKLTFNLKTEGTVHKNELGRLTIQVKNKSLFPISKVQAALNFENKLTNELDTKNIILSLNSKGSEELPLEMSSKYCGQIRVTVKKIRYYDFLGIFTRTVDVNSSSQLFVLPQTYPVNVIVSEANVGFIDSYLHENNRRGTDGLEVFGIKEYGQEDSLKNIHWKLTSKFDELIVKELTEAVNYTFLLLIDLTVKNRNDKNDPAVIDAMMDTFISISEELLNKGYEHSIGWLDKETDFVQIETIYSTDQLTSLLKEILLLEQIESQASLLDKFTQSDARERFSHIVYLTSEKGHLTTNDLAQTKITELICHLEKDSKNVKNRSIYTPKTKAEDLYELSI